VEKEKQILKRFIVTGKYVHKFSFISCRMVPQNMHAARRSVGDRLGVYNRGNFGRS